jgi:hypothetical protein
VGTAVELGRPLAGGAELGFEIRKRAPDRAIGGGGRGEGVEGGIRLVDVGSHGGEGVRVGGGDDRPGSGGHDSGESESDEAVTSPALGAANGLGHVCLLGARLPGLGPGSRHGVSVPSDDGYGHTSSSAAGARTLSGGAESWTRGQRAPHRKRGQRSPAGVPIIIGMDDLSSAAGPAPDRIAIWPVDDGRYGLDATLQGASGYERARAAGVMVADGIPQLPEVLRRAVAAADTDEQFGHGNNDDASQRQPSLASDEPRGERRNGCPVGRRRSPATLPGYHAGLRRAPVGGSAGPVAAAGTLTAKMPEARRQKGAPKRTAAIADQRRAA